MSAPARQRARDDDAAQIEHFGRDGALVGKSAAIADWRFRSEQRDFEKLVQRLRSRNWARRERAERPEVARTRLKRWRDANRERVRAADRRRRARKRRTRLIACKVCAAKVPATRRKLFCGRTCRNKFWGQHRPPRSRGIRNMSLTATLRALIAAEPGLTLNAICERAPTLKRGSVATKLTEWTKAGVVRRVGRANGKRAGGRYYLAGAA